MNRSGSLVLESDESMRKILQHIEEHLEDELDVDSLSLICGLSRYHFHRQFCRTTGLNVYRYIQLKRLKRASYRLAFRPASSILSIALDCGYEGPEAFSRAFRKRLGQSPSQFRKDPQWHSWQRVLAPLSEIRGLMISKGNFQSIQSNQSIHDGEWEKQVRLVDFPETPVAVLSHRGDPGMLGETIRSFISWRRANNLGPKNSATFNVFYCDPEGEGSQDFRLDLCAGLGERQSVDGNTQGVVAGTIAGGRCAALRYVGSDDLLASAFHYLYTVWLPLSGEKARPDPPFCQRFSLFPDTPENEAVVELFLPLR